MRENEIGDRVIHTAIELHRDLGPGLFESVYESILAHLLEEQGLCVQRQVAIPVIFRGLRFEEGFVQT